MTAGRGDCKGIHERTVIDESIGTPPRDARFVRFQISDKQFFVRGINVMGWWSPAYDPVTARKGIAWSRGRLMLTHIVVAVLASGKDRS